MKKRILVVAAHPDDEILGCGGTMARLSREGHAVHVVILGEGITSRQQKRNPRQVGAGLEKLHAQVNKAAKIAGAKSAVVHSFPDNRFDSVNLLDIVKVVESEKKRVMPQIVFTHHAQDLNIDHQMTFQAVLTACRPVKGETVKEIYSFEVPSSTEWQVQSKKTTFLPTVYFALKEKHLRAKIRAMKAYSSEMRPFPHPRSSKALKALATWRGTNIGENYAECFEAVRRIT